MSSLGFSQVYLQAYYIVQDIICRLVHKLFITNVCRFISLL